ncbi:hypothetical protein FAVG1_08141 [Fusarium avenaceum]|nr:hypothetical protein FAVG1_08141 [Fusarium avenaceum]
MTTKFHPTYTAMAFYFQPPIFGNYLLSAAPRVFPPTLVVNPPQLQYTVPLYVQPAPVLVPVHRYITAPTTRIKVIFHRAGTILGSNDAYYNYAPSRDAVLGNVAWWAKGHGLGDRAYSGQCTLFITRSHLSTLHILPGTGPVTPLDIVRKMSFTEQLPPGEFESLMSQIAMNGYGAFIVVDHAYVPLQLLAQGTHRDPVPDPPPSPPPTPPPQPSNDHTNNNSGDSTNTPQTARPASAPPIDMSNTSEPQCSGTGNGGSNVQTPAPGTPDLSQPEVNDTQTNDQKVDDTEPKAAEGGDGGVANS